MTNPNKKPKGIVARRKPRAKIGAQPIPTCPLSLTGDGKKRYSFVLPIELGYLITSVTKQNDESANTLVERAIRAELKLAPVPPPKLPVPIFLTNLSQYNWAEALKPEENKKESDVKTQ